MKKYDSVIIGHLSKDINIDHEDNKVEICGGAVLYSSASAYALGHKVAAVTKISRDDIDCLSSFTIPKDDIYVGFCEKSTSIKNKYFTADKERRECKCISQGSPFNFKDIENVEGEIYHLAGLIYGDFSDELIKDCSKLGKVAVDVQGLLRHADKQSGDMYFEDWKTKKELLPYITFLKTDAAEAEILTGESDRKRAAEILYSWGAKEILITHNTEVLAFDGKEFYTCPIKSRNLSGRTGRGDTTFAAYINERLNSDIKTALLTATATVSLKMETPGAFKGTRKDVEEYIREFYK
ncbi:MAG: ribokinase [Ruminococcaceae bacterium]|nr:ribokinase [Oscillospiraceae bacterium]